MSFAGKKIGLLLSTTPDQAAFRHGVGLARAALDQQAKVYLYCIDDAVEGLTDPGLQALRAQGLVLYACAYGAQRRNIPLSDHAVFAGLGMLADLIVGTDRFLSFN